MSPGSPDLTRSYVENDCNSYIYLTLAWKRRRIAIEIAYGRVKNNKFLYRMVAVLVKMKYGAQWKVANLRDTSLQPNKTKAETIEFDLPAGVRAADVTVDLVYEDVNPDNKYPIHSITKRVSLDK